MISVRPYTVFWIRDRCRKSWTRLSCRHFKISELKILDSALPNQCEHSRVFAAHYICTAVNCIGRPWHKRYSKHFWLNAFDNPDSESDSVTSESDFESEAAENVRSNLSTKRRYSHKRLHVRTTKFSYVVLYTILKYMLLGYKRAFLHAYAPFETVRYVSVTDLLQNSAPCLTWSDGAVVAACFY